MVTTEDEPQPMDELMFRSPPTVQQMGGIQTNTVLPYFARSPFFDGTSNNATLQNQAMYNPQMYYLVQTRAAFEGHLRSMGGLEFVVVHDPSEGGQKVDNSGVWVIRKQNRRKRTGAEDEITPLGEYYVVGDCVFMAPSVGAIVESRMLSAAQSLTCLFSLASTLPLFNPSLGHVYLPPRPKPVTSSSTNPASLAASQQSKENTPLPSTQRGSSVLSDKAPTASTTNVSALDRLGAMMLAESLSLTMQFGNEYMDETPLVGEPGNFIIQKVRPVPAGQAIVKGTGSADTAAPSATGTPVLGKVPPPLKTDLPPEERKKGKGGDKSSPASPLSPLTPGGKRRKKSRSAQGVGIGGKV